jgi:ADP-ribosylglycohydrolase
MRVAPVGLFASRLDRSLEDAFRLGTEFVAITHGHPMGTLAAGILAVLVLMLADGTTLVDALAAAKSCLRAEPRQEKTLRAWNMRRSSRILRCPAMLRLLGLVTRAAQALKAERSFLDEDVTAATAAAQAASVP